MNADFPVVIDACVLVQSAVRDTLLRLAERRLFICKWSDQIIDETVRTLQTRINLQACATDYLVSELHKSFPDAWAESGYKDLVPVMPNHEKDRHVVAVAVKENCETILTYNLKDFPADQLQRFAVRARHPDEFLIDLYWLSPETVVQVLHEQGQAIEPQKSLKEVLSTLERSGCPRFARLVEEKLDL